jgi:CRISPR-associated protein Cmr1
MRALPASSPPDPARIAPRNRELLSVEIQVVTPLAGGSARPGQPDPDLPVRGSSVRGQLRFWWRACRAATFAHVRDLYMEEARIWGAATGERTQENGQKSEQLGPGGIDLVVEVLKQGQRVDYSKLPNALRYALFPFQEQKRENKPEGWFLKGVSFRLRLLLAPHVSEEKREELEKEARAAVWAWVCFGGIGARTRRGCGALYCSAQGFHPEGDPARWLVARAREHATSGQRTLKHPTLTGARFVVGSQSGAERAWIDAVNVLQKIRQGPGIGRNPGQGNRPGRSYWPEPDTIRDLLKIDQRHRPEHPSRPWFPRADLGLPILFQNMIHGLTPTLAASGDGATRFASPLIVKPLALSEQDAVPLVLLLNAPHVWEGPGVVLDKKPIVKEQLQGKGKPINPQREHLKVGSAREAVLNYAAKQLNRKIESLP